jgi:hypothetical protein
MVTLTVNNEQYKTIVHALEVYLAILSEEYDNNQTIINLERMSKVRDALNEIRMVNKNGKFQRSTTT